MRYLCLLTLPVLLSACSDGNTLEASTPQNSTDIGCTQEYYQTMIGNYVGTVSLNETGPSPRMCSWETEFVITGTSLLTRCLLRASTVAVVTQMTFYPDDDLNRYQCLNDSGERGITESVGSSFPIEQLPMLDNSNFPIQINISKNNLVDSGPYFGDSTRIARYVNLFDGSQSDLADALIVEGDGTFTMLSGSGELLGTLVKSN